MFSLKVHAVESAASREGKSLSSSHSPTSSTPLPRPSSAEITELHDTPPPFSSDEIVVGQMKFSASAADVGGGRIPEASVDRQFEDMDVVERVGFSSGNPRVECSKGAAHLFRNTAEAPGTLTNLPPGRGVRVCVLAVPNYMTVADYCRFCWPLLAHIEAIRVVRNDQVKDRYMVLMTMDSQDSADRFFRQFNGKPFSSLEAELCRVLFVAHLHFTTSARDAALPPSGQTELPSCPVCLERLDQHISGILTTVCNHSFHSSCISNWTDSSCPVCRYGQEDHNDSQCALCGTSEDLWICLICGVVGCGRYREGHAVNHFEDSQHCYSLELETQRVWDYVGDNYVHRLIQSKTDGKLVELPAPGEIEEADEDKDDDAGEMPRGGSSGDRSGGAGGVEMEIQNERVQRTPSGARVQRRDKFGRRRDEDLEAVLLDSKMDAIAFEYNHLLTMQLESQRQYFEGLLVEVRREKEEALAAAEKAKHGGKMQQRLEAQVRDMMQEQEFLRQVNDSLVKNQEDLQKQLQRQQEREKTAIAERDEKITCLEEQVRDLMFNFEAQRMIDQSGNGAADLRGGSVVSIAAPPTSSLPKGKGSKNSRRK